MRLLVPSVPRPLTAHGLPRPTRRFIRRELNSKNITFIIVIASLVLIAFVSILVVACVKARRRRRLVQGQGTETGGRWSIYNLLGRKRFGQSRYEQTSGENLDGDAQTHQLQPTAARSRRSAAGAALTTRDGAPVDRNTSVRSVMTLPAYRATADNNEQVLGREGDRDGVDVIVDLPTSQEQEDLRDQEMEAIYQIRVARREQIAERDELRRQRREARSRGDSSTLAEVRARSRAASNNSNFDELRQEVSRIQDQRHRSVSSVSYADLGVARHDGTRIRANSDESERMALLSDAASIAISTRSELRSPRLHRRDRSASSLASVDSELHPESSRPRVYSRSTTPQLSSGELGAGSSPEIVESDLRVESIPPPEYEVVSLADDVHETARSTTPLDEPPPDYSGPNQNASRADETTPESTESDPQQGEASSLQRNQGVGGIPQLPSLRISGLPAIVIGPMNEDSQRHDD